MSHGRSSPPGSTSRVVAAAATTLALAALAPSCGDDAFVAAPTEVEEPTATVEVTVVFPDDTPASVLASTHLWVLALPEGAEASCAALIGGDFEPYDLGARTVGDVASLDTAATLVAASVPLGPALVYVEGVDYLGDAELAGCAAIDVVEPTTTASVSLGKARTFDCADPATEEGAPCDDGRLCTVGETCEGGTCGGALARSCTHVADACNAESCDEELGCVATPLSDGTPCQDGLFCTSGDVCQAGACLGAPLDCQATAETCQVAVACDEATQQCVFDEAPNGTACDDGLFCTTDDFCQQGACVGPARDCDADAPTCQVAIGCDDTLEECLYGDAPDFTSCDDGLFCTTSDRCSSGACEGGAPVDCSFLDGECVVGACDEAGEVCVAEPRAAGVGCDDGLFCTTADVCDGDGACDGVPLACPGGTTCTPQVCNEGINACEPDPAPAGTGCDDADACTMSDVCNGAGQCAGVLMPDCP